MLVALNVEVHKQNQEDAGVDEQQRRDEPWERTARYQSVDAVSDAENELDLRIWKMLKEEC